MDFVLYPCLGPRFPSDKLSLPGPYGLAPQGLFWAGPTWGQARRPGLYGVQAHMGLDLYRPGSYGPGPIWDGPLWAWAHVGRALVGRGPGRSHPPK